MAKHDIVGKYIRMTARERIEYIYKNYKDLDYLKESYRDYAVETISFLKQQENCFDDDLGVRVQTSFNAGSITERMAFENIMIKEMLDKNYVPNEFMDKEENQEYVNLMVFEWNIMRSEFSLFEKHLKTLSQTNFLIARAYLSREKGFEELGREYCVEPNSVKMRMYRIKKILTEKMVPFFAEYGFNRQTISAG